VGIDKSNVHYIIHRAMPKDVESWHQEIGHAGRGGCNERLHPSESEPEANPLCRVLLCVSALFG
jgi:superfamily II DNA/RNA helicase